MEKASTAKDRWCMGSSPDLDTEPVRPGRKHNTA